jgi:hypothetical protein
LAREKHRREVAKDWGGHGFFQRLSLRRESGSQWIIRDWRGEKEGIIIWDTQVKKTENDYLKLCWYAGSMILLPPLPSYTTLTTKQMLLKY